MRDSATLPRQLGGGLPFPSRNPPAFNVPKIILWLIGVTFGMHLFLMLAPDGLSEPILRYLVFNPAHLEFFTRYPEPIATRWLGHALVHGGWLHILVNCAFLMAFGSPLARQIPTGSFLVLYAGGAIGGAGLFTLLNPALDAYLVGASGAISALVGALSRMVFLRRGNEHIPHPFSNRRAGIVFIAVFFGINLLFEFLPGPGGGAVAGESHIGGFIAGFMLSLLLPWRTGKRGVPENG